MRVSCLILHWLDMACTSCARSLTTFMAYCNSFVAEDPPNEDAPDAPDKTLADKPPRLLRGGSTPLVALPEPPERLLAATPVIDVLVVYTQGAKADAAADGYGPIVNLIDLAIAETNQAYANSGIDVELRLAGGAPYEDTGYTADVGSTSLSPSLNHLTSSTDGQLDYVHQLRTERGADMVALITTATGSGCGIAWKPSSPSAGSMFSVTKYSCATGECAFSDRCIRRCKARRRKSLTSCARYLSC